MAEGQLYPSDFSLTSVRGIRFLETQSLSVRAAGNGESFILIEKMETLATQTEKEKLLEGNFLLFAWGEKSQEGAEKAHER